MPFKADISNYVTGSDYSRAFDAACHDLEQSGGGILYVPGGTAYTTRRPICLSSNITMTGDGPATIIKKAKTVRSNITANVNKGTTYIPVADGSVFRIGDAVNIADSANYEWLSSRALVIDILGNILELSKPIVANYQAGRGGYVSTSFPLIASCIGSKNIRVERLTLDQNAGDQDPDNNFTLAAIHFVETYSSVVEDCTIKNAIGDAYSDQGNDGFTPAPVIKNTSNIFRNNIVCNARRHAVHLGTYMAGAIVTGNIIEGCGGYAVFYCAFVTHTIVSHNIIRACGKGCAGGEVRDTENQIVNNNFDGMLGNAIEPGPNSIVSGNIITNSAKGILIGYQNCIISDNIVSLIKGGECLTITKGGTNTQVNGGKLTGAWGGTCLLISGAANVFINGLMIIDGYYATSIQGVKNMKVSNSPILKSTTTEGWVFTGAESEDVSIELFGTLVARKFVEKTPPKRVTYI